MQLLIQGIQVVQLLMIVVNVSVLLFNLSNMKMQKI